MKNFRMNNSESWEISLASAFIFEKCDGKYMLPCSYGVYEGAVGIIVFHFFSLCPLHTSIKLCDVQYTAQFFFFEIYRYIGARKLQRFARLDCSPFLSFRNLVFFMALQLSDLLLSRWSAGSESLLLCYYRCTFRAWSMPVEIVSKKLRSHTRTCEGCLFGLMLYLLYTPYMCAHVPTVVWATLEVRDFWHSV
jgi:hypothetical protein